MPTYKLNEQALAALGMARTDIKALSYALDRALNLISTDLLPEGDTNLYYTNARARAAISVSGDLSYSPVSGVITYNAPTSFAWSGLTGKPTTIAGYGITDFASRFYAELDDTFVSIKDPQFGAVGNGSSDDSNAMEAALTYAIANNKTLDLGNGTYLITRQIALPGFPSIRGNGDRVSKILTNFASNAFVFTCNSLTDGRVWDSFSVEHNNGTSVNTGVAFVRIEGDTTFFQHNRFENITARGFESVFEIDKTSVLASSGYYESPFAWNRFVNITVRGGAASAKYGIHMLQGSGTGNNYHNFKCKLDAADAALLYVEGGANNAACGDIIWTGNNTGGTDAALLKVGDNTTYRSRMTITGSQFDAGMVHPLDLSSTGSTGYTGITLVGNNVGGLADIYTRIPELEQSQIHDKGIAEYKGGYKKTGGATGSQSYQAGVLQMATNTGVYVTLTADGTVQGVGSGMVLKRLLIRRASAGPTVTVLETAQNPATAGFLDITLTSTASGEITFFVTYNATSSGSSFTFQLATQGGKIKAKVGAT